jgi:hypothetical protein
MVVGDSWLNTLVMLVATLALLVATLDRSWLIFGGGGVLPLTGGVVVATITPSRISEGSDSEKER